MPSTVNLQEFLQQTIIPVYGVIGNPFEVQLISLEKSFTNKENNGVNEQIPTNLTLKFASRNDTKSPVIVHLYSYNSHDEETRKNLLSVSLRPPHPRLNPDSRTLRLFKLTEEQQIQLGKPNVIEQTLIAAGKPLSATIHYWHLMPQPTWFLLVGEDALVFGETLGLSIDEVMQLFQVFVIVNDRTDLIEQYQREIDEHLHNLSQ